MRRLVPILGLLVTSAPLAAQLPQPAEVPVDAPAEEWVAGQLCWAFYEPHMAWYAAHVVEVVGDSIRVEHFDGYDDTVGTARVRRDFVAVGDTVGAFFSPDTQWYSAVVKERRGMDVVVEYSDGEEETTWLKWIRVKTEVPGAG